MRSVDPQVLRVLDSVSTLLERKIQLTEADTENETVVISRPHPGSLRIAVRDADDLRFSEVERVFLREMLELLVSDMHMKGEYQSLDQRLRLLEKENVDLSMKNRALAEISSRDALTGLYTRWYVLDKIEAEMNRALRHGNPMSLLMLDIDHFKQINDTHGHPVGDQILQIIGQVLRDSCRIYDIPGRYGGEEFCLMLPETKLDKGLPVADRIRKRIETTPFPAGDKTIHLTASIGVAGMESVPEEALFGATSLIERADRALYIAKDRGRNRVELWTSNLVHRPAVVEH